MLNITFFDTVLKVIENQIASSVRLSVRNGFFHKKIFLIITGDIIFFNESHQLIKGSDMEKWEWNSSLETGIELIDEQHHELFARIDQFELAIYNGTASHELKGIFEYLKSYIIEHLEAEEKILRDCNYPDFERHFEEHESFRKLFAEMSASYKEKGGDNYLAIDVDKQLRKWWENHILKMDMAYAPFVRKEADYL